VFILFWIWKKKRYWLYSSLTILIGFGAFSRFFGTSIFTGSSKNKIKVLTYNTDNFNYAFEKGKTEREAELLAFFKEKNPDIFCFQELGETDKYLKTLTDKFFTYAPFYVAHPVQKALFIVSKYPIVNSGCVNLSPTNNDAIFADININGSISRVYCAHLQSNSVGERTKSLMENKEINKESAHTSRAVWSIVRYNYSLRAEQSKKLKAHILQSPYPVIVCGDFNDTPQTYVYSQVAEGLEDTWQNKGLGRGTTYGGALPLLRIDYILTSEKFKTINCEVDRSQPFSDHYPVMATIGW
jgi:endonuclease/exonuclease/phosphatase family metal-dependent hydrolase